MEYTINTEELLQGVTKYISRFAAGAYGDDATSLYDVYKVTSRDTDTLKEYINDGVGTICSRLFDVASRGESKISFEVPDFDSTMTEVVNEELSRFLKNNACALWLADKNTEQSERFEKRATAALDRAHVLLKSRKAPKRS